MNQLRFDPVKLLQLDQLIKDLDLDPPIKDLKGDGSQFMNVLIATNRDGKATISDIQTAPEKFSTVGLSFNPIQRDEIFMLLQVMKDLNVDQPIKYLILDPLIKDLKLDQVIKDLNLDPPMKDLKGDGSQFTNVLIATNRDGKATISDIQTALEKFSTVGLHFNPIQRLNDSNMYALVARQPMAHGLGGSSSTGILLSLYLDSGATIHVVGDNSILTNLHDPPPGMVITVANGTQLAIDMVGDIQTQDITIRDVYYARGLKMNLISVRQLAKNKIVTTFYENHAELKLGGAQIGDGIFDDTEGLYKLRYLHERSEDGTILLFI